MTEVIKYRLKTVQVIQPRVAEGEPLSGPDQAVAILRGIYAGLDADVEHFTVLALDARGKAKGFKVVSTGTMTASLVHPREVFRAALHLGAAQIIVCHNHPSGDASPSPEDLTLTDRLRESGNILGIPVVDHIVLGSDSFRSLG